MVLLADADLLELPLEAVSSLRAEVIDAVSRDISLQLLYHRLTSTPSGKLMLHQLFCICFIHFYPQASFTDMEYAAHRL